MGATVNWGIHRFASVLVLGGLSILVACGDTATIEMQVPVPHDVAHSKQPLQRERGTVKFEKLNRFDRAVVADELEPPDVLDVGQAQTDAKALNREFQKDEDVTAAKKSTPSPQGDRARELDPSGIFEVRETGFLPAPNLRLVGVDGDAVQIEWSMVAQADGYVVTAVEYSSDGTAEKAHTFSTEETSASLQSSGHRILVSVRAFSTQPARRSDSSNKLSVIPSDS